MNGVDLLGDCVSELIQLIQVRWNVLIAQLKLSLEVTACDFGCNVVVSCFYPVQSVCIRCGSQILRVTIEDNRSTAPYIQFIGSVRVDLMHINGLGKLLNKLRPLITQFVWRRVARYFLHLNLFCELGNLACKGIDVVNVGRDCLVCGSLLIV